MLQNSLLLCRKQNSLWTDGSKYSKIITCHPSSANTICLLSNIFSPTIFQLETHSEKQYDNKEEKNKSFYSFFFNEAFFLMVLKESVYF